jgi:hypothetical protein
MTIETIAGFVVREGQIEFLCDAEPHVKLGDPTL